MESLPARLIGGRRDFLTEGQLVTVVAGAFGCTVVADQGKVEIVRRGVLLRALAIAYKGTF